MLMSGYHPLLDIAYFSYREVGWQHWHGMIGAGEGRGRKQEGLKRKEKKRKVIMWIMWVPMVSKEQMAARTDQTSQYWNLGILVLVCPANAKSQNAGLDPGEKSQGCDKSLIPAATLPTQGPARCSTDVLRDADVSDGLV